MFLNEIFQNWIIFVECSIFATISQGADDFGLLVFELLRCLHDATKAQVLPLFNTLLEIHAVVPLHPGGWDLAHEILVGLVSRKRICTSDIGGMVKVRCIGVPNFS